MAVRNSGLSESFEVQAAAVGPATGVRTDSWLDRQHPEYARMLPRWQKVNDFYLGEVADDTVARTYLIRRFQGEPDESYKERLRTADYTPHLGTLIDTLAGMLYAVDDRASRVWSGESGRDGLGDPATAGTLANRLTVDADGLGCGWTTIWRQFTIDVINHQLMWVLVDTADGEPVVKLISPVAVPNWVDGPRGPIEVLMCEQRDQRASLEDTSAAEKTYIRWGLTGWTRWAKTKEGVTFQLAGTEGAGVYKYVDRNGKPTLPIFPVRLPIRRYVAWLLAEKAQVIFNQESVRDFAVRIASFTKLVVGVESDEQYEKILKKLVDGENVLPEGKDAGGAHRFIAPLSEPARLGSDILDKKIEHFWVAGFKMYADAARERTATEIKQEVAGGVGAFLQLLKAAVDDAENGAMWRLEQAERSESPETWGVAHVERSDDFSSIDLSAILDQMRKRYLGETPVPVGRSALVRLAEDSARYDGLPVDKDEIAAAVDAKILSQVLGNLTTLGVIPAMAKARLAMRLFQTLGLIKPGEVVKLGDGTEKKLLDQLTEEAEGLARAQEEAERRLSEFPPLNGGGG